MALIAPFETPEEAEFKKLSPKVGQDVKDHADRFVAGLATTSHCVYCGEPATCWDHVIPHSFDRLADQNRQYSKGVVPSCSHCNGILGAVFCGTLDLRLEYLAQRVRAKYRKLLRGPAWTQAEIKALGRSLRDNVIAIMNERRRATRRLHFLERGSFDAFNEVYNESGL
jgi:hypothetical protein